MKLSGDAASIDHETASYHRFTAVALVTALALLGGFGIFAQTVAASSQVAALTAEQTNSTTSAAAERVQIIGSEYPPVVAYVDGHAISGKLLAQYVYGMEQSQDPNFDKSHPERDALQSVIRNQILLDHAADYGISISLDQARAEAESEKPLAHNNPLGRADVAILAEQLGVSVADYFDQPQVINGYRDALTLGAMQSYILNHAPVADRDSEAKEQAALNAFVDGMHAKVQVLITVQ